MHRFLAHRLFLLALVAGLLAVPTGRADDAAKKRPITLEDLWQIKRPGPPTISPDGKWVAVEVTTYNMEENDSTSDIWLLSTDGKTQKQLTSHKAKESDPKWSPDGKQIAFVSKRDGDEAQIYLISPDGGEARQLSKMPMSPSALKWSADGKSIFCIAWTWPDTADDESYKKKDKAQKDNKVKAYIIDDAQYRYWDKWIADGKRPMVFAVDTATGKHRNLLAGVGTTSRSPLHLPPFEPSANDYDLSPDGKELCFVADSTKEFGKDFNSDLYVIPLNGSGEAKNITQDNPANDTNPLYTPDGKGIGFLRQTIKYFYADRKRLMVYVRESGKIDEVVHHFDGTGDGPKTFDRSINSFRWSSDKSGLSWVLFEAEDKGHQRLWVYGGGGVAMLAALTTDGTVRAFDLSKDGKTGVFLRSTFSEPAELYVMRQLGEPDEPPKAKKLGEFFAWLIKTEKISHFNDDLVAQWDLGEVKEEWIKGADDRDVQMWVVYPPGFDAKKKWPLLQIVHGGPHNGITTDFHFRWNLHMFASKGYVVACVNFHGSSGFGQEFTDSITGDLGTKPMIDILKSTDYMEAQPYIDKSRTTCAGASYGGYMMAWLNGHTDRFKAMVCHAGVYSYHSQMASDIVRGRERQLGAFPWGDLTKVDKQSAQRYAANFKTPTLVIHGEKDYRVPVTQGFEYYNTLKMKGVPARLVYFPDENHWVLKPQNSRLWHQEFFAWLDKYVGHGPTPQEK